MAERSSATLVRDGSRHYWRGAIRIERDTVIWECDHEHKERGADRLDYYGRSFGAMLCAAQELRRRDGWPELQGPIDNRIGPNFGRPISERQA